MGTKQLDAATKAAMKKVWDDYFDFLIINPEEELDNMQAVIDRLIRGIDDDIDYCMYIDAVRDIEHLLLDLVKIKNHIPIKLHHVVGNVETLLKRAAAETNTPIPL